MYVRVYDDIQDVPVCVFCLNCSFFFGLTNNASMKDPLRNFRPADAELCEPQTSGSFSPGLGFRV